MKKLIPITFLIALTISLANCSSPIKTQNPPQITQIKSQNDQDKDGIDDYTDIIASARAQIGIVTNYDTNYYSTGYPPNNTGACADVIWRALKGAGYDFKEMIDFDIQKNPEKYPQNSLTDENINFRRVQNIKAFLELHAEKLTTEIETTDNKNLELWQGGDIVTYAQIKGGLWHIAIVSDKRNSNGIPLLIHNYGQGVKEDDYLTNWPTPITGHYRLPKNGLK